MNNLMKRTNGNTTLPAASFNSLVDRMIPNDLSRFLDDGFWGFQGLQRTVHIPVNILEKDKNFELQLIAPGLNKEDFKVSLTQKTLTVSFEQDDQKSEEAECLIRNEFTPHSFSRSFQLDDIIDTSKITAQYKDGILYLSLMKKEEAQTTSRLIEIN